MKPLANSPVEVAKSTLGEVANRAGGLLATHPFRSELVIANGGLCRNACRLREKQPPPENCFKTTPSGKLVYKSSPSGEICHIVTCTIGKCSL